MARKKKDDKLAAAAKKAQQIDANVAQKAAPFQGKRPIEALTLFSKLGDQPPLRILCGMMIAAGLAGGERRLARAGARALIAHSLATAAKDFVKQRVDRSRPHRMLNGNGSHRIKPGRNEAKSETSFPSGHSAGAIAVARAVTREFPDQRAAALGAAGLIALGQIPRCSHYPTDVGAGLAIGAAAEAVTDAAWNAAERSLRARETI